MHRARPWQISTALLAALVLLQALYIVSRSSTSSGNSLAPRRSSPTVQLPEGGSFQTESYVDSRNDEELDPQQRKEIPARITAIRALSPEEQRAAIEELVADVPDADQYLLLPLILNPPPNTNAVDALVFDTLFRPDPIRARTFLKILETPQHPARKEALFQLKDLFGEDHSDDLAGWKKAYENWLKQAEEAEQSTDKP